MNRLAAVLVLCVALASTASPTLAQSETDLTGVFALLDVLDAVMAKHADYAEETTRLEAMDEADRRRALDEKAAANAADEEIARLIGVLYATPGYQMYFMQFRHITRETHRGVLLALPYEAISSPAGISHNLRELCLHRDAVRSWVSDVVGHIDLESCRDRAQQWLPEGEYSLPPVRFVYDGNGDAFALLGGVCFDLFSLVLRDRPRESRFDDLGGVGVERIERVLAHEFHHVFARPLRKRAAPAIDRQEREWRALAERVVSEGVAMRCDVEAGIRRDAMEDTATVVSWIADLNEKSHLLDVGKLGEGDWQEWLGATYHGLARERLRAYLSRTHPDADIDALVERHVVARPSMIYALGWWMVSRILEGPDGSARTLELLSAPEKVFEWYNDALGEAAPVELRIETRE